MRNAPAASLCVERVRPDAMSLRTLATLRITVFRGWPLSL
jgi:hypothetical protein